MACEHCSRHEEALRLVLKLLRRGPSGGLAARLLKIVEAALAT
jgi:hypothetical protein